MYVDMPIHCFQLSKGPRTNKQTNKILGTAVGASFSSVFGLFCCLLFDSLLVPLWSSSSISEPSSFNVISFFTIKYFMAVCCYHMAVELIMALERKNFISDKHQPTALPHKRKHSYKALLFSVLTGQLEVYVCSVVLILLTKYLSNDYLFVPIMTNENYLFVLAKIIIVVYLYDFIYFVFHYAFHRIPLLYKYVHKAHHDYTAPYALAAHHGSTIEITLLNVFLPALLSQFAGLNEMTQIFLLVSGYVHSVKAHSGFLELSSKGHDKHHQLSDCNYSLFGMCDKLFGTSK